MIDYKIEFVWRWWMFGWLKEPLPRGSYRFYHHHYWQFREDRWITFGGKLAIRI